MDKGNDVVDTIFFLFFNLDWLAHFHLELLQAILFLAV